MFSIDSTPAFEDVAAVLARHGASPLQYVEITEVLAVERSEEKFPFLAQTGVLAGQPALGRELAA